jgi:hypothetical protein
MGSQTALLLVGLEPNQCSRLEILPPPCHTQTPTISIRVMAAPRPLGLCYPPFPTRCSIAPQGSARVPLQVLSTASRGVGRQRGGRN